MLPMTNRRPGQRWLRWVLACVLSALAMVPLLAQGTAPAVADAGERAVSARCLGCHGPELIQQQRLSRPGWIREIEKMERWGAVLTADEKASAADYLARDFGVAGRRGERRAAAPASTAGRAVLERRCLTCHQVDLIEQQRLASAGWTRELDKMVRWGAVVTDSEWDDLVRYLTEQYGPRR